MLTLATIHTISFLIAMFASYFPTVAISGYFAAWVAKKCGDDTAEQLGMLTLNPLEHTKLFGLIVLLMTVIVKLPFIVAFGRYVPINEKYITGKFKKFKYLVALCAKPLANLFLTCAAIFCWVLFWKLICVPYQIATNYPGLLNAVQLLYVVFRQINIISLLLELIFALVIFVMSFIFSDVSEESVFVILIVQIYLLLLSWYFVAPYIQQAVMMITALFSYSLAYFIGL